MARHRLRGWLCQECDHFIDLGKAQVRKVPLWPGDEQRGVHTRLQVFCPSCGSQKVRA